MKQSYSIALAHDEAFSHKLFDRLEELKDKMIKHIAYVSKSWPECICNHLKFEIDDRLGCVFSQFSYYMGGPGVYDNIDIDTNKNEVLGIKFEYVPNIWCGKLQDPTYRISIIFDDNTDKDVVYVGGRGDGRWNSIIMEQLKEAYALPMMNAMMSKVESDVMDSFRYGIESYGFFKNGGGIEMRTNIPEIKDVKYNGPATVVLWTDGTKTVVKAENEKFDPEKGLAMAIAKKCMGTNKSKSNYYDIFKKWLPKDEEKVSLLDFFKKLISNDELEKSNDCNNVVYDKMSVAVYCERTGYSKDEVYRMLKNGELNAAKDEFGHWMIFLKRNE